MKNPSRGSIRQFATFWLCAVWFSFVLLGCGLLYVVPRLNAKTQREYADSRTLDDNHRFELALVSQGRADLRWHLSADPRYQREIGLALSEADVALDALQKGRPSASSSDQESQLLGRIAIAFKLVRARVMSPSRDSPQTQAELDDLLSLVHQHRDLNAGQMEATLRSSDNLDDSVRHWIVGVLLLASLLLLAGSLLMWARLLRPMIGLAQTVQTFGGGDLKARVPVKHPDEIGHLSATFNAMAEAIAERERDRLRFVATVAHDLKNPLVVIGGGAHLLKNKEFKLTSEERAEWLGVIVKQTHKLEAMIGDLTDGVQAETGQLNLDMKKLDLALLTREAVEEYAATVKTHLISHDIAALCFIDGDRKRMDRVLTNLVSNAVKYSAAGSEVQVTLTAEGSKALLSVRDEGAGIAPEDLPKLFLPFSRLERTKKMASGTGLGLSSVKKIVEGHGGSIKVESTLGVGTTVEVHLPLLEPVGASESISSSP